MFRDLLNFLTAGVAPVAFSKPSMPAPVPVPVSPMKDTAAEEARNRAATEALAESKSRGRASTIAAGRDIAEEEQEGRGLIKSTRRRAAREALGL